MVGRLIQYQKVIWLQHQSGHSQARALATRENFHLLVYILSSEQECSQNIAQTCTNISRGNSVQSIEYRKFAIHQVVLILCVISYIDIRANLYCTLCLRQLADNHTRHCGLTLAIASYECNLLASLDGKVGIREYSFLSEGLTHLLNLGHNLSRTWCGRELYIKRSQVLLFDLYAVEFLELLDTRLYLITFGRLISEFLNKLLGLLYQALLILVCGHLLGTTLGT